MSLLGQNTDENESEESDEYEVCDHHGHDYRDLEPNGIETKFQRLPSRYQMVHGILTEAVPGTLLGVSYLSQNKTAPCRDCPKKKHDHEVIEKRVVFKNGSEVKTIAWEHYKSMEERYEARQQGLNIRRLKS